MVSRTLFAKCPLQHNAITADKYVNFVPFPTFRAQQDATPLYLPNLLQKDQNSSIFNGEGLLLLTPTGNNISAEM